MIDLKTKHLKAESELIKMIHFHNSLILGSLSLYFYKVYAFVI